MNIVKYMYACLSNYENVFYGAKLIFLEPKLLC